MLRRSSELALAALLGSVACGYLFGLLTGTVTIVGYEGQTAALSGAVRTSSWSIDFGVPVRLAAQQAIRADFDVDARFGAVTLTVAPPLWLRTSLQAATAYVEGKRTGSILFVAEAPGWYTFAAEPSSLGGPRCREPGLSLKQMFAGDPNCPTYDVTYKVTWHVAGYVDRQSAQAAARVNVPKPNGKLAVVRIRD